MCVVALAIMTGEGREAEVLLVPSDHQRYATGKTYNELKASFPPRACSQSEQQTSM